MEKGNWENLIAIFLIGEKYDSNKYKNSGEL